MRTRGDPLPRCHESTFRAGGGGRVFPPTSCTSAKSESERREVYGRPGTSALPEQPRQQTNQLDGAPSAWVLLLWTWKGVLKPSPTHPAWAPSPAPAAAASAGVPPGTSAALFPPLGFGSRSAGATGTAAPSVPSRARLSGPRRSTALRRLSAARIPPAPRQARRLRLPATLLRLGGGLVALCRLH